MLNIRCATMDDLPVIMEIMDSAIAFMRATGNPNQWVNGYPSDALIRLDIAGQNGYVVVNESSSVLGYFVFHPGPDPTYARIYNGSWINNRPYHVVHRIAAFPDAHGIFSAVIRYCLAEGGDIRIDTYRDNLIMQHLLEKHKFTYCGIIYTTSGSERLAYQRVWVNQDDV